MQNEDNPTNQPLVPRAADGSTKFTLGRDADETNGGPRPWYDNREAMSAELEASGLAGLVKIATERAEAGYKRDERMTNWVVLGAFILDACGNIGRLSGQPSPKLSAKVETTAEAGERIREMMWSLGEPVLPEPQATCDRCFQSWNLSDAHTARFFMSDKTWRHEACNRLKTVEDEHAELCEYLHRAEVPVLKCWLIPSQYGDEHYPPWMVAKTEAGHIVLGWRKRVIVVDWSRTDLVAEGRDVVAREVVTHGPKMVHAWGPEAAIDALRRICAAGRKT